MCGGAPVAWLSWTHKCVTLSTSEVEYVAMGDCAKEALFVRSVWCFLFPNMLKPCVWIYKDNQGAIRSAQNPLSSSKNSKHIDVRHHFLCDLAFTGEILIVHVASEYHHADMLMKPLKGEAFVFHRDFVLNL